MEVGFTVAFLGGALALLSPCGALLLPAYLASAVGHRARLRHSLVFFAGLVATLAPLGLGAGLLGAQLAAHRGLLITVAGWLVVLLGVVTALGGGFDLRRLVPARPAPARRVGVVRGAGLARTFALGAVGGVAGFCVGPILGAVLTLAATGSPLVGAAMLVVYGAGMVVPMVVLAALWGRLGVRGRTLLRGREVTWGPVRTHTTSLVTGVLLAVVGVVFLRTNGLAALPDLVPAATLARLQSAVAAVAVPDVVVIVVAAAALLAAWWWYDRRRSAAHVRQDDGQA